MLDAGADVDAPSSGGQLPMLVAIRGGHAGIIEAFLAGGVTITDQMVQNAILVARDPALALKLLEAPNPTRFRTSWLKEARSYANERGMKEVGQRIGEILRATTPPRGKPSC